MNRNRFLDWLSNRFKDMLSDDASDIGDFDRLHHWQYGFFGYIFTEMLNAAIELKNGMKQIKGYLHV